MHAATAAAATATASLMASLMNAVGASLMNVVGARWDVRAAFGWGLAAPGWLKRCAGNGNVVIPDGFPEMHGSAPAGISATGCKLRRSGECVDAEQSSG